MRKKKYTILGAWDGNPDRYIISYQTAIGQALLGHKAGESILLQTEHDAAEFTIVSIQAAPVDEMTPKADSETDAAVETATAQ